MAKKIGKNSPSKKYFLLIIRQTAAIDKDSPNWP
jgi:hypothetical protein